MAQPSSLIIANQQSAGPRDEPLLTSTALVPAARASLPPRPGVSSTLWICSSLRSQSGAPHASDCQAPGCIGWMLWQSKTPGKRLRHTRTQTHSRWRACWPSGMWQSCSELPGRMGAARPARTASPTPSCCGASIYANPRLSPATPAQSRSVIPGMILKTNARMLSKGVADGPASCRKDLVKNISGASEECTWRTLGVAHKRDTRATVGIVLQPLHHAVTPHRRTPKVNLAADQRRAHSVNLLLARHALDHMGAAQTGAQNCFAGPHHSSFDLGRAWETAFQA